MEAHSTRVFTEHSVLGQPMELPPNQLPTSGEVFRCYDFYLKFDSKCSVNERAKRVADKVKELYVKAGIPTVAISSIIVRIKRLVEKVHALRKYPSSKKDSDFFQTNLASFDTLFDVCSCKCVDNGVVERNQCSCALSSKVPPLEWNFWLDQKTSRKMYIGLIDRSATLKLQKRKSRAKSRPSLPAKSHTSSQDNPSTKIGASEVK